MNFIFHLHLPF
jgi:chromatin-remodeling ATPase INO80